MNEELYFSLKDFIEKLESSSPSDKEKAIALETEIRRVENLKVNIVDDNMATDPAAAVYVCGQIDSYIMKLQQILSDLPTNRVSINNLSATGLQDDRDKAFGQIEELGQEEKDE